MKTRSERGKQLRDSIDVPDPGRAVTTGFSRTARFGNQSDAQTGDAVGLRGQDIVAVELNGALAWPDQTAQCPDHHRPAHAVASHQRHDLACGNFEVDAEQRLAGAIPCLEVADVQKQGHRYSIPR